MIMIHGFGGGGPVFCKMIADLRKNFSITTVDLLGLGASGRPDYTAFDRESAVEFYLDSLKAWIDKAQLDNEPYWMLGHSFGGFIAGQYVLKHPKNVNGLILMSSVGVTARPPHMEFENIAERQTDVWGRYGVKWMNETWTHGSFALFDPLRVMGRAAAHKLIQ